MFSSSARSFGRNVGVHHSASGLWAAIVSLGALLAIADRHGLPLVSIADLIEHRRAHDSSHHFLTSKEPA